MRILFVSWTAPPDTAGGTETHMRDLAREYRRAGHQVVILTGTTAVPKRNENGTIIRTRIRPDNLYAGASVPEMVPLAASGHRLRGSNTPVLRRPALHLRSAWMYESLDAGIDQRRHDGFVSFFEDELAVLDPDAVHEFGLHEGAPEASLALGEVIERRRRTSSKPLARFATFYTPGDLGHPRVIGQRYDAIFALEQQRYEAAHRSVPVIEILHSVSAESTNPQRWRTRGQRFFRTTPFRPGRPAKLLVASPLDVRSDVQRRAIAVSEHLRALGDSIELTIVDPRTQAHPEFGPGRMRGLTKLAHHHGFDLQPEVKGPSLTLRWQGLSQEALARTEADVFFVRPGSLTEKEAFAAGRLTIPLDADSHAETVAMQIRELWKTPDDLNDRLLAQLYSLADRDVTDTAHRIMQVYAEHVGCRETKAARALTSSGFDSGNGASPAVTRREGEGTRGEQPANLLKGSRSRPTQSLAPLRPTYAAMEEFWAASGRVRAALETSSSHARSAGSGRDDRRIGLIIVSTVGNVHRLEQGIRLAKYFECPLVVMCSDRSQIERFQFRVKPQDVPFGIRFALAEEFLPHLESMTTLRNPLARGRAHDLWLKRTGGDYLTATMGEVINLKLDDDEFNENIAAIKEGIRHMGTNIDAGERPMITYATDANNEVGGEPDLGIINHLGRIYGFDPQVAGYGHAVVLSYLPAGFPTAQMSQEDMVATLAALLDGNLQRLIDVQDGKRVRIGGVAVFGSGSQSEWIEATKKRVETEEQADFLATEAWRQALESDSGAITLTDLANADYGPAQLRRLLALIQFRSYLDEISTHDLSPGNQPLTHVDNEVALETSSHIIPLVDAAVVKLLETPVKQAQRIFAQFDRDTRTYRRRIAVLLEEARELDGLGAVERLDAAFDKLGVQGFDLADDVARSSHLVDRIASSGPLRPTKTPDLTTLSLERWMTGTGPVSALAAYGIRLYNKIAPHDGDEKRFLALYETLFDEELDLMTAFNARWAEEFTIVRNPKLRSLTRHYLLPPSIVEHIEENPTTGAWMMACHEDIEDAISRNHGMDSRRNRSLHRTVNALALISAIRQAGIELFDAAAPLTTESTIPATEMVRELLTQPLLKGATAMELIPVAASLRSSIRELGDWRRHPWNEMTSIEPTGHSMFELLIELLTPPESASDALRKEAWRPFRAGLLNRIAVGDVDGSVSIVRVAQAKGVLLTSSTDRGL